jgi:hypothetical protein
LVLVVLPFLAERVVPELAALALGWLALRPLALDWLAPGGLALGWLALWALIRPPGWNPPTAPPGRVGVVPGWVAVLAAPAEAALPTAAPSEPRVRTAAANGMRQRKVNTYSWAGRRRKTSGPTRGGMRRILRG